MLIHLVTPAPPGSRSGNRVTAGRWAAVLRSLGHRVRVATGYGGGTCDLLVALHAYKSFDSIRRFRREHPEKPLVVGLAGTDLYRDVPRHREARLSLDWATRLVALQPAALTRLPACLRGKTRVILQSANPPAQPIFPPPNEFRVCVVGHLRPVKDPFRAALAARFLPESSRIRVLQLGRALDEKMERRARELAAREPRYSWPGEVPHARALRILAGSRLLVLSSRMEGGANVISEALAARVPILASRISGSVGLLGQRYAGFFPFGDTARLARLMARCESEPGFRARLERWCRSLAPLVSPARERAAWRGLLRELFPRTGGAHRSPRVDGSRGA